VSWYFPRDKEICDRIVADGFISLMSGLIETVSFKSKNHYKSGYTYTFVCQIMLGISAYELLSPTLANAIVAKFLQEAMQQFWEKHQIQVCACRVFRLAVYPFTKDRRAMAPRAVVELVLNAINLFSHHSLQNEFLLTLNVFMQSKRNIYFV